MSSTGLTPEGHERLVRLEAEMENLDKDVTELKGEIRTAIRELRQTVTDLRLAMASQASSAAAAVAQPMAKFDGMKLALVGLGGIIMFFVTLVGGVLGIVAYFKTGAPPPH